MARPRTWNATLTAACHEAVLAVRLYNDAGEPRAFEGFLVHMHMAWLYMLHARFTRDGTEFRYRDRLQPHRFVKVDGEYKRWELTRCVEERWPNQDDPVRNNIEFFIALRNRVEHRHAAADASLALGVAGHAQAHLLNFEEELVKTFGDRYSLATSLRFPVFVGSFTTEGTEALTRLRARLPTDLRRFIADFHDGLSDDLTRDSRFEIRLRVVLEQVQRDADALAIQFTRWDDLTEEQKQLVTELGRRGQAIVREQKRPVVGHGLLRPQEAEREVAAAIPFEFNSNHFLRARQIKGIRPASGDAHPERTDERYCLYDEFSRSYGYTKAWVKYLAKKCSTKQGFREATGREPRLLRESKNGRGHWSGTDGEFMSRE
ncbi:MAG: DUF3644 domain-containing protein [Nocardioides sp.]